MRSTRDNMKNELKKEDNTLTNVNTLDNSAVIAELDCGKDGKVLPTTTNYQYILNDDPKYQNLFAYDCFANKIVCFDNGTRRMWTDSDDASLRCDIEERYGLYNIQKYMDAFNSVIKTRSYHPLKELIEHEEWDGVPRIDTFLTDILKCDKNDYSREVSRMIFYGGISRLYRPGCKFDYMPIFIGKQGTYKSTIVNWLALHDDYAGDINTIEGKDALDNIQGRWICEFSELLALVRTKDVEAMKSFITKSVDKYRTAYAKRTAEFPRQCIFIGTTNDIQFLSDKTGNRRYLPIVIHLERGDLDGKEEYVRNYILQCWREALVLYKENKTYLTIPNKYYQDVLAAQEDAVEDDPKMGIMMDYLDKKKVGERVCTVEIFTNCFNNLRKNFNRLEAKEISRMLSSLPDWERHNSTTRFDDFGTQKYWEKISPNNPITEKENKWDDLD